MDAQSFTATEFKARCLEIFDRLARRELQRVVITKRGHAVAVLTPPDDDVSKLAALHGFMRGSVSVPEGLDLTIPVLDEAFDAERGILHR